MDAFTYDAYKEAYTKDKKFNEIFQQLQGQVHEEDDVRKAI